MKLKTCGGLVLRKENLGGLCYAKDIDLMLSFDLPAFFILERLAQGEETNEIVSDYADAFTLSSKKACTEVTKFIEDLKIKGVVNEV